MRNGQTKKFNVISLILLIILIILFHTELFILGVRVYVAVTSSAEGDKLLGNYYRMSALQNEAYADTFYMDALNKYQNNLKLLTNKQTK